MEKIKLQEVIGQFKTKKVLVVGDFYLDEYITGQTEKFSPEAPVPRVIIKERTFTPGCAGNVTMNLASLGAQVTTLGVIGQDNYGKIMLEQFQAKGINTQPMLQKQKRLTGTFSRLLLQGQGTTKQHMVRMDNENQFSITEQTAEELMQQLTKNIPQHDIIFVADYDEADGKGIIRPRILQHITNLAKQYNKFTVGISRENIKDFEHIDLVVCNELEAEQTTGKKIRNQEEFLQTGEELRKLLNNKITIISKGKEGMYVFEQNNQHHTPSFAKNVVDVCGAGDTLTSTFTLAINSNTHSKEAAELASHAAAISIAKPGTATATPKELLVAAEQENKKSVGPTVYTKIKTVAELKAVMEQFHQENKTTIFTNGYFDGLHTGHVKFLQQAKKSTQEQGKDTVLIVGVNTNRSVKENKGPNNPKNHEEDRALMLAALSCVDYVVLFDELTPIKTLKELKPKLLVKGGNFTPEQVVGKDLVNSYGGELKIIPVQTMRQTQ